MAQQVAVNAAKIKQEIEGLLNRVSDADERIVIERDGEPVAVMIPYEEWELAIQEAEQLRRELAAQRHKERVRIFNIEAEKQGLTEEQLYAEIKADRKELFNERYGHLFDKQD